MIFCPLKTLAKYRDSLWALLQSLGPWGVFVMAAMDGAGLPLPGAVDAVVVTYVYASTKYAWLYVLLAAVGSALGSLVLYFVGRAGGEVLIQRRMTPAKFEKVRADFEEHPVLTLAIPALLPPPFPFKVVVLSAGAFEMRLGEFLLTLLVGRAVRFGVLAWLTVQFGPGIIYFFNNAFRRHPVLLFAGIAALIAAILIAHRLRRNTRAAEMSE
ncbi:MAG: YqaA family protein [Terriglobales bacterium]